MNNFCEKILKYTSMVYILPLIILSIIIFWHSYIPISISFVIGGLYYGLGRGITLGCTFLWKDGNGDSLPNFIKLNGNTKSSKYHTFTLILAIGLLNNVVAGFLLGIFFGITIHSVIFFTFAMLSMFFVYYFIYARAYNFIRRRNWYNLFGSYCFHFCNKSIFIEYISKNASTYLFVLTLIIYALLCVI